jgi:hypothetical protein
MHLIYVIHSKGTKTQQWIVPLMLYQIAAPPVWMSRFVILVREAWLIAERSIYDGYYVRYRSSCRREKKAN